MFWTFLIVAAIAIGLIYLGALSVWITVLKTLLLIVLAFALAAVLLFVWRRFNKTH